MKVAVVQMSMAWTLEENLNTMLRYINWAASLGAQLIVFPELSTCGFTRLIKKHAKPGNFQIAHQQIQKALKEHGLSGCVGSVFFDEKERPLNCVWWIDSRGKSLGYFPKVGLTDSERRFFNPGKTRGVVKIGSRRASAFLCREADDFDAICQELARGVDLLLWPGYIAVNDDSSQVQSNYFQHATTIAKRLGCSVIGPMRSTSQRCVEWGAAFLLTATECQPFKPHLMKSDLQWSILMHKGAHGISQ